MKKRTVRKIKDFCKKFFAMVMIIVIFCGCSWYENHYNKEATVISIYENIVTVKDDQGEEWQFEDNEKKYIKDDVVMMTMNSMGTIDNVYDDKVEKVKKILDK